MVVHTLLEVEEQMKVAPPRKWDPGEALASELMGTVKAGVSQAAQR